jgi:hypothetical protein
MQGASFIYVIEIVRRNRAIQETFFWSSLQPFCRWGHQASPKNIQIVPDFPLNLDNQITVAIGDSNQHQYSGKQMFCYVAGVNFFEAILLVLCHFLKAIGFNKFDASSSSVAHSFCSTSGIGNRTGTKNGGVLSKPFIE